MHTLLRFYDKDALKNVLAVLTLRPQKVIFLYDRDIQDQTYFASLKKCFQPHMPDLMLETIPVNSMSLDDIYYKTLNCILTHPDCAIELTGGSEFMSIAGYKAAEDRGIPIYYTDIMKGELIRLGDKKFALPTVKLQIADFITAKGAEFIGNSHQSPSQDQYNNILEMCQYLFQHITRWKETCSYLQTVAASFMTEGYRVKAKRSVVQKNGQRVFADKEILYQFLKTKFITDIRFTKEEIRFTFVSSVAKQYMINFGIWLELFVYICAKKTQQFEDVVLGAMVDWDAYDGLTVAGNEIDVILMDHSMPVFISCKLREADTAALNELLIEKKRLGGWFSKCILVTFSDNRATGLYKKAKELGIGILDKHDIMSGQFGTHLLKKILEQDLNSLKWKKI